MNKKIWNKILLALSVATALSTQAVLMVDATNRDLCEGTEKKEEMEESKLLYEGRCGENVTFYYDQSMHVLKFEGEGSFYNYESFYELPWSSYYDEVERIVIGNGVYCKLWHVNKEAAEKCSRMFSADETKELEKVLQDGMLLEELMVEDIVVADEEELLKEMKEQERDTSEEAESETNIDIQEEGKKGEIDNEEVENKEEETDNGEEVEDKKSEINNKEKFEDDKEKNDIEETMTVEIEASDCEEESNLNWETDNSEEGKGQEEREEINYE